MRDRSRAEISQVIIHGISLPPGKFGTGDVESLFTNTLDVSKDERLADLTGCSSVCASVHRSPRSHDPVRAF